MKIFSHTGKRSIKKQHKRLTGLAVLLQLKLLIIKHLHVRTIWTELMFDAILGLSFY